MQISETNSVSVFIYNLNLSVGGIFSFGFILSSRYLSFIVANLMLTEH